MEASVLKLYEHVDDYLQVLDWIDENAEALEEAGGELPPELEELLDQVEGDVRQKVERTGLVVLNLLANVKEIKAERDRLKALAAGYERQANSLKEYLKVQLQRLGETRVDGARCKVRVQRASRPAITAPEGVPPDFQRVRIELDGTKAYEHVKPLLEKDGPDSFDVDGLHVEYTHSAIVW